MKINKLVLSMAGVGGRLLLGAMFGFSNVEFWTVIVT